jgi:hypothetical protein
MIRTIRSALCLIIERFRRKESIQALVSIRPGVVWHSVLCEKAIPKIGRRQEYGSVRKS